MASRGAVLSLQNGMGSFEDIVRGLLQDNSKGVSVLEGVTDMGGLIVEPGVVRHTGHGHTILQDLKNPICAKICEVFTKVTPLSPFTSLSYILLYKAGLHTELSTDIAGPKWLKLIVNSAINPITAILGVPNGEILKVPHIVRLMRAITEVISSKKTSHPLKNM